MANMKQAKYQLRDYNDGELIDAGVFLYHDWCMHIKAMHTGAGMIFDLLDKSSIDEYLGHMLCEHIDSITSDERTMYFHDDVDGDGGIYPHDYTPQFCITDDGDGSLAALKPYLVLRIIEILVINTDGVAVKTEA